MTSPLKVYLAGPDVFLPDALPMGQRKAEICRRHGVIGLYPLDNALDLTASDASMQIYRANEAMMRQADAVIANLTPFRGPGADAGTVYELGFMAASGKLCFGYSNVPGVYLDRVSTVTAVAGSASGAHVDAEGNVIEDFGLADNLMMIHALDLYGAALVTPTTRPDDIWRDLTAFEACVRLVCMHASSPSDDRS